MNIIATTLTEIIATATSLLGLVTDTFALFMEPPVVYFVSFAVLATAAGMANRFIPKKKK